MFVEGLEDKTPEIRAGACEALGKFEVSSGMGKGTIIHRLQNYELSEQKQSNLITSVEIKIIIKQANCKNLKVDCMQ